MRRRRARDVEQPGGDAFLDVVANLVGILIILVMIIGARANDALVEAATHETSGAASLERVVGDARLAVDQIQKDILATQRRRDRLEREIAERRQARDYLHARVTELEMRLDQRAAALDQQRRQGFEDEAELEAARRALEDLTASTRAMRDATPPPEALTHLPTPMARTVFGREEHFRLLGGRLAPVPFESFVERLKQDAERHVWKLKDAMSTTESLGPIDGFRMRYTLKRTEYTVPLKAGVQVRQRVELDHFVLTPVREDLGEPFEAAIRPDSQFSAALERLDPARTTITVWVYPDSFEQFRQLKQFLFERGFLAAGRPMPENMPIGGSPSGSHSAAQ